MMNTAIFSIGPIPLIVTALSMYSYGKGVATRINAHSVIVFSTLLLGAFFVTILFYKANHPGFAFVFASQSLTAAAAFLLLRIATVRAVNGSPLLSQSRKGKADLWKLLVACVFVVIAIDSAAPLLARTCTEPRCATFGALFGALGGQFQPYYMLNFFGGLMILSIILCGRHLNKSTFKR